MHDCPTAVAAAAQSSSPTIRLFSLGAGSSLPCHAAPRRQQTIGEMGSKLSTSNTLSNFDAWAEKPGPTLEVQTFASVARFHCGEGPNLGFVKYLAKKC